jgi:hypothetical protein
MTDQFAPKLHYETFDYLRPPAEQLDAMEQVRRGTKHYADLLEALLPPGPDKTFVLRSLRTVAMWANVAITRCEDGSPRE